VATRGADVPEQIEHLGAFRRLVAPVRVEGQGRADQAALLPFGQQAIAFGEHGFRFGGELGAVEIHEVFGLFLGGRDVGEVLMAGVLKVTTG
jgi:hypothetical protein